MKRIFWLFGAVFVSMVIIAGLSIPLAFGQSDSIEKRGGRLPPPVDIEATTENTPQVNQEVTLIIRVNPLEDMHADISCLLPEGVKAVRQEGIMVQPCMDRYLHEGHTEKRYNEAVGLWVGPMQGNTIKEFRFKVVMLEKEKYEFIVRFEALAKWGVKEQVFVIDLE